MCIIRNWLHDIHIAIVLRLLFNWDFNLALWILEVIHKYIVACTKIQSDLIFSITYATRKLSINKLTLCNNYLLPAFKELRTSLNDLIFQTVLGSLKVRIDLKLSHFSKGNQLIPPAFEPLQLVTGENGEDDWHEHLPITAVSHLQFCLHNFICAFV